MQQAGPARELAQYPAAYLRSTTTKIKQTNELYKHFSPDVVEEENLSEWDNNAQSIVSPSKREAINEEKEIAALPWLIDIGALNVPSLKTRL